MEPTLYMYVASPFFVNEGGAHYCLVDDLCVYKLHVGSALNRSSVIYFHQITKLIEVQ